MSATIESPPEKENPASGETSGIDEQNLLTETTVNTQSAKNQAWKGSPKTLDKALKDYHQLVDAGAIPEKAADLFSGNLSDADKVKFHKEISKNPPGIPNVSESRHPDGSRNWQVVNARRKSSKLAKQAGVTRYSMDRLIAVRRALSKEQWKDLQSRILSGELKGSALRKAEENILKEAEGANRQIDKSLRKIKSLWKCLMKEAKKCQDPDTLSMEELSVTGALLYLVRSDLVSRFSFTLAHEELFPECQDLDTEEGWR